jgi:hypothetical protein
MTDLTRKILGDSVNERVKVLGIGPLFRLGLGLGLGFGPVFRLRCGPGIEVDFSHGRIL